MSDMPGVLVRAHGKCAVIDERCLLPPCKGALTLRSTYQPLTEDVSLIQPQTILTWATLGNHQSTTSTQVPRAGSGALARPQYLYAPYSASPVGA